MEQLLQLLLESWKLRLSRYLDEIKFYQEKGQQNKVSSHNTRITELRECINSIEDILKQTNINHTFTTNDIDGVYLLGVFNTGGLDKLEEEIQRLKKIDIMPHELLHILKNTKTENYDNNKTTARK
jgi:hypothetical protein